MFHHDPMKIDVDLLTTMELRECILLLRTQAMKSIHEHLKDNKQIANIWSVDDVLEVADWLTEDEAWEVLQRVYYKVDCSVGISWETLETQAQDMYPNPNN